MTVNTSTHLAEALYDAPRLQPRPLEQSSSAALNGSALRQLSAEGSA
jgi:hypothetical protein